VLRVTLAARGRRCRLRARAARIFGVSLSDLGARTLVELCHENLLRFQPTSREGKVRWHDPCQLGRGLGQFDPPRTLLSRLLGRPPEEFSRRRAHAACSGAGGILPATMPGASRAIAADRVAEHAELGGGLIVTACASSLRRLRSTGADVTDLSTLLAAALART
jgi:Fe-S oxidoreductase